MRLTRLFEVKFLNEIPNLIMIMRSPEPWMFDSINHPIQSITLGSLDKTLPTVQIGYMLKAKVGYLYCAIAFYIVFPSVGIVIQRSIEIVYFLLSLDRACHLLPVCKKHVLNRRFQLLIHINQLLIIHLLSCRGFWWYSEFLRVRGCHITGLWSPLRIKKKDLGWRYTT